MMPRRFAAFSLLGARSFGERHGGFTLLELLVALAILTTAITLIWSTFTAGVRAWQLGTQTLDELRHGDFVMEQLVSALRSTAYFPNSPERYGFRLETKSGNYPAHRISWVTSSTAFLPPDSPWRQSLHRLVFSIENNERGEPSVAIRALSYLADPEEQDEMDVEPWFVSSEVKGFRCRVYDFEKEEWSTTWENTNSIPSLLEISLYMDPVEKYGEPLVIQRIVTIPVAPAITNAVKIETAPPEQRGPSRETAPARTEQPQGRRPLTLRMNAP